MCAANGRLLPLPLRPCGAEHSLVRRRIRMRSLASFFTGFSGLWRSPLILLRIVGSAIILMEATRTQMLASEARPGIVDGRTTGRMPTNGPGWRVRRHTYVTYRASGVSRDRQTARPELLQLGWGVTKCHHRSGTCHAESEEFVAGFARTAG
jgi:hypothetical protein